MDYYFVLPSRHNSGKNIVKFNLQLTWPVRLFSMKSLKTHIIFFLYQIHHANTKIIETQQGKQMKRFAPPREKY